MDYKKEREMLYSSGVMINFPIGSEEYITVDKATQLYYAYLVDDQTEKCEYLKREIKKARQIIRNDYQ